MRFNYGRAREFILICIIFVTSDSFYKLQLNNSRMLYEMNRKKRMIVALSVFFVFMIFAMVFSVSSASIAPAPKERECLIFGKGTPQELEVYKIYGREHGPTIMIMGGIQGDEPGGFLSADLYADLVLKRGNIIVVPRANFKSIVQFHRGPDGDMNRKFADDLTGDPERDVVEVIKSLIRESDVFLNMHDGSGYYRPKWESDIANPDRYGQSIIADASIYNHTPSGRLIELEKIAMQVIERINKEINLPLHKFHFFNTNTEREDSQYKEQRKSATYYALTKCGIPAFGVETSKQLPTLEMKIYQHNLAVNAFLDIFGVEVDHPGIMLDKPVLGYIVVSINEKMSVALADGQVLMVSPGDIIEVVDVRTNYDRGLSVEAEGESYNVISIPLKIDKAISLTIRKDNSAIGLVKILPESSPELGPQVLGMAKISAPKTGMPVAFMPDASDTTKTTGGPGKVIGFYIEVDGQPTELKPDSHIDVLIGSMVKIVDLKHDGGELPENIVMNLKGFVPEENKTHNTGEDRGFTADTGRDMMPAFSVGGKGEIYHINAEVGKNVFASCSIKLVQPKLASVTIKIGEKAETLTLGKRITIPVGTSIELTEVILENDFILSNPHFTLGGHGFPAILPQTLTMSNIAVNLAVFNGDVLAGKVTLVPR